MSSTATTQAEGFRLAERRDGEDNVAWLRRQLDTDERLTAPATVEGEGGRSEEGPPTLLLLLGGRTPIAFRLRVAQSHVRHDLSPSHWSHAALLGPVAEEGIERAPLYEVSLEPRAGFGFPALDNGVQVGSLGDYDDPGRHPNIAVLRVPVPIGAWSAPAEDGAISVLERFGKQRTVLDTTELLLDWLAFAWGVGRAGNPLLGGRGIPSAAMIEVLLSAVQYDITPGLESRASCPEAIWQAARWWHLYYTEQDEDPIEGCWHVEDRIGHHDQPE